MHTITKSIKQSQPLVSMLFCRQLCPASIQLRDVTKQPAYHSFYRRQFSKRYIVETVAGLGLFNYDRDDIYF
jgi:hypothetical protein